MSHALSRRRSRALATGAVLALTLGLSAGVMSPASATPLTQHTQSNPTAIPIPDYDPNQPYESVTSVITVPADTGVAQIGDFSVTLKDLSHTFVSDLYITLVSPDGTFVDLMCNQAVNGGSDVSHQDLTFSSDGTGEENCDSPDDQTYLSDFAYGDPAGDWTLYAHDDETDDTGIIAGGFSITFDQGSPQVTTQPMDTAVPIGTDASFTAYAVGTPEPTVQWQVSTDNGGNWSDISGATDDTLTVSHPTLAENKSLYRAVFSNSFDDTWSHPATLTVGTVPSAPQNVTATQTGPGQVTISWAPPADNGSSSITDYDVGYGAGQYGDGLTVGPEIRSHVFSGLSNGAYTFSVSAENGTGGGRRVFVPVTVAPPAPPAPPAPARTTPTLTASKTDVISGDRITLTGTGQPGETVSITRVITGFHAAGTTAVVDSTGHFSAVVTVTSSAVYQAKGATGLTSPTVFVSSKSKMTMAATRVAKRKYTLSGSVLPVKSLQVVKVYYKKASGAFGLLGSVKTNAKGKWAFTHTYSATKKFTFKAVAAATEKNASNYRTLTVSVH